jgi:tRNA(fMet)-specific endonuclease VapC
MGTLFLFGAELVEGGEERYRVARLMKDFVLAPFGEREDWEYGAIRSEPHRSGTPIGQLDMQIAAAARCRNWIVVTHNTTEFSRVQGLRLVDWQGA